MTCRDDNAVKNTASLDSAQLALVLPVCTYAVYAALFGSAARGQATTTPHPTTLSISCAAIRGTVPRDLPKSGEADFFRKAVDESEDTAELFALGVNYYRLVWRGFRPQQILQLRDPRKRIAAVDADGRVANFRFLVLSLLKTRKRRA